MHSAPAVTYPVGRCHIQTYLTLALWALGAVVCVLWIRDAGRIGWPQGLAVSLGLLTGALALRSLLMTPEGSLRWDGQQWTWQTGRDCLSGTARPTLDLQRWVVLEFQPQAGRPIWFWVARANEPARWDALRRALWSRVSRAAAAVGHADGLPDAGRGHA